MMVNYLHGKKDTINRIQGKGYSYEYLQPRVTHDTMRNVMCSVVVLEL